ncbi:MAG: response regulator, partial [Alphaproteobacteria bacterium]|nr:response regulator [Alphaproteobacteria bacterium]
MAARVLVVDDILPNVKLLEAKLSSEYFDVITALSGAEGIQKAETLSPDIILLDVMMPGMDGFEACHRLKSSLITSHIPVVMVTALTDATDRVRGLEAGADDFLSKPVNDVALMARVRSLVRLKMTVDEWRIRENTANQFGFTGNKSTILSEHFEKARVLAVEDKTFESEKFIETLKRDEDAVTAVRSGDQAIA